MNTSMAYIRSLRGRIIPVAAYAWLANLGFSLFLTLGFCRLLDGAAGRTLLLDKVDLYGDFTVWMELLRSNSSAFRLLLFQAMAIALLFSLFSIFFSGGIYRCFLFGSPPKIRNLLRDSWTTFLSFAKIFLASWLIWIPAMIISLAGFALLLGYLKTTGNETTFQWLFWIWAAISFLLGVFALGMYDFARIRRLTSASSTWKALCAGLTFARRRFASILLLYLIFLFPFLLLHPLWSAVMQMTGNSLPWIIVFSLNQVFIWIKYLLKIFLMHAETEMIRPHPSSPAYPETALDAVV